jgi:hypothetical protein
LKETGEYSFDGIGVEKLTLPSSIEIINAHSFVGCRSLKSLVFESGSNLQRIENDAFTSPLVMEVQLPNSVCFISGRAFDLNAVKSITFYPCPIAFCVRDEMVEDGSAKSLILYLGSAVSYDIPKSVETIGDGCFRWNKTLEFLTFEWDSSLQRIGEEAFRDGKLKGSIVLPRSVKVLSEKCFSSCKWLETVIFESGSVLQEICEYGFAWSGLQRIIIPASVVIIGNSGFRACKSLEFVRFESGSVLEAIGVEAFIWSGLKGSVIPAAVKVIDSSAFLWCDALTSVTFEPGSQLIAVNACAFDGCPCTGSVKFPPSFLRTDRKR